MNRLYAIKQFFSPFIVAFLLFLVDEYTNCCINIVINFVKIKT